MEMTLLIRTAVAENVGASRTITANVRNAVSGGGPSSVTRTLIMLVLGAWAGVGVQVNRPDVRSIDAPAGALGSSENVSFCVGRSASVALAVKFSTLPTKTV